MSVRPTEPVPGVVVGVRRGSARTGRRDATCAACPAPRCVRDRAPWWRRGGGSGRAEPPSGCWWSPSTRWGSGRVPASRERARDRARHMRQATGGATVVRWPGAQRSRSTDAGGTGGSAAGDEGSSAEDLGDPDPPVGGDDDTDADMGQVRVDHVRVVAGAVHERRVDAAHARTEADVLADGAPGAEQRGPGPGGRGSRRRRCSPPGRRRPTGGHRRGPGRAGRRWPAPR